MLKKSKKRLVSLSIAMIMVLGCAMTAFATTQGTKTDVTLPAWMGSTKLISGALAGTNITIGLNSGVGHIYCDVYQRPDDNTQDYSDVVKTATWTVDEGSSVTHTSNLPKGHELSIYVGNDFEDYRQFTNVSISYTF